MNSTHQIISQEQINQYVVLVTEKNQYVVPKGLQKANFLGILSWVGQKQIIQPGGAIKYVGTTGAYPSDTKGR